MKRIFFLFFIRFFGFLFLISPVFGQINDVIEGEHIKNYLAEIIVNRDASVDIKVVNC